MWKREGNFFQKRSASKYAISDAQVIFYSYENDVVLRHFSIKQKGSRVVLVLFPSPFYTEEWLSKLAGLKDGYRFNKNKNTIRIDINSPDDINIFLTACNNFNSDKEKGEEYFLPNLLTDLESIKDYLFNESSETKEYAHLVEPREKKSIYHYLENSEYDKELDNSIIHANFDTFKETLKWGGNINGTTSYGEKLILRIFNLSDSCYGSFNGNLEITARFINCALIYGANVYLLSSEDRTHSALFMTPIEYLKAAGKSDLLDIVFKYHTAVPHSPTLHYMFIGPLKGNNFSDSMRAMSLQVRNPIEFIGLDQYLPSFQEELNGSRIVAKSAEDYLNEAIGNQDLSELALEIERIRQLLLDDTRRHKILDLCIFREVFTYLLLALKGGYVLATNVSPTISKTFALPQPTEFAYPWRMDPEVWMLYSPPGNNSTVKAILKWYLNNWENRQKPLEGWLGESSYPYKYHIMMNNLLIDCIVNVTENLMLEYDPTWKYDFTGPYKVSINGIPVEKEYGNSHKHPEHFAYRLLAMSRDQDQSDFNSLDLEDVKRNFAKQLLADLIFNLNIYEQRFPRQDAPRSLRCLKNLLSAENSTYSDLIESLKNLKNIKIHNTFLSYRYGVNAGNLWLKQMAERIESNFEYRTEALLLITQKQQPAVTSTLK